MKRIILMAAAAALLLSSCCRTETLRIVQYNVGVFSKEIENSIPMIADMMKEVKADVVSLNELDSCNLRHSSDQLADFAQAMGGWDSRYGKAFQYREGGYGVGVASSDEIRDSFVLHLEKGDGSEYRACCVVETDGYVLASTHLDYKSDAAQLAQAMAISSALCERYGRSRKPVFLCGDLNAKPESETVKALCEDFELLSDTAFSYPSEGAYECIDYIFALRNRAKVGVVASKVMTEFESGDVAVASDHLPVFAEVSFRR